MFVDQDLQHADWPKRTPDTLAELRGGSPIKNPVVSKSAYKPEIRDGDGDGKIYDGTKWERAASPLKKKASMTQRAKRRIEEIDREIVEIDQAEEERKELLAALRAELKELKEIPARNKRAVKQLLGELQEGFATAEDVYRFHGEREVAGDFEAHRYTWSNGHTETDEEVVIRVGKGWVQSQISAVKVDYDRNAHALEHQRLDREIKAASTSNNFLKHELNRDRRIAELAMTPAFQEWFGDSETVDKHGMPLLIYHGTKTPIFTEFEEESNTDVGVFGSTDIRTASTYSGGYSDDVTPTLATSFDEMVSMIDDSQFEIEYGEPDYGGYQTEAEARESLGDDAEVVPFYRIYDKDGGEYEKSGDKELILETFNSYPELRSTSDQGVYPLFFALKNPAIVEGNGANWDSIENDEWFDTTTRGISSEAKQLGYDGVIFKDIVDSGASGWADVSDVYVSFEAENIKSLHNAGTFDPKSEDILKSLRKSEAYKPDIRDGDGDGKIYDGTKWERAAPQKQAGVKQTDTPEFKRWFGESKVVDEAGEPIELFHGSPEVFDEFLTTENLGEDRDKAAFFSSSPGVADGYANSMRLKDKQALHRINQVQQEKEDLARELFDRNERRVPSERYQLQYLNDMLESGEITREEYDRFNRLEDAIYDFDNGDGYDANSQDVKPSNLKKVFLKMENPAIVDADGMSWDYIVPHMLKTTDRSVHDGIIWRNIQDSAKEFGDPISDTYAVFEPTQIKSATGNNGEFDPNNPNISKRLRKSAGCGANAQGGGGFQPGNTCAAGRDNAPKYGSQNFGGWFVSGRADGNGISGANYVIQATQDWDVADQYAGDRGAIVAFKPKSDSVVVDWNDDGNLEKVFSEFMEDYEYGVLSPSLDEMAVEIKRNGDDRNSFAIADLVDSAGVFDNQHFASWYWEKYGTDVAVINETEAVLLNPQAVDQEKIIRSDSDKKPTSAKKSSGCGANAPGGGGFQPGNNCAAEDGNASFGVEPKVGDSFTMAAYGLKSEHEVTIREIDWDKQIALVAGANGMLARVPVESLEQLYSDTTGDYSGMAVFGESRSPEVNKIIAGEAEFLGKGADGVVHDVGDGKVVKSSTTVPYHAVGGGKHLTVNEAVQSFGDKVKLEREMYDAGIPGVMKTSNGMHGTKVFSIRQKLDVDSVLDDEQIAQLERSIKAMHEAGYTVNDEIQVGVSSDGDVYHFDLGQASRDAIPQEIASDLDRLRDFKKRNASRRKKVQKSLFET